MPATIPAQAPPFLTVVTAQLATQRVPHALRPQQLPASLAAALTVWPITLVSIRVRTDSTLL